MKLRYGEILSLIAACERAIDASVWAETAEEYEKLKVKLLEELNKRQEE